MLPAPIHDFVIIGSGFGGSVSAMRLVQKGYSVLILERGRRFNDEDFPKSNWNISKSIWLPMIRSFGMMQFTLLNGVMAMRWSGVGGGSLGYANVLMEPSDELFAHPTWKHLADWKTLLRPHFDTAKHMLGVTRNPSLWPADHILKEIAVERGYGEFFQPTDVGVFFGESTETVPDPFFGGEGPDRAGCRQCGGCMVGCRYNAKNTLPKNYLYFAEKWGAEVRPEAQVTDIRPLPHNQPGDARYEVEYRRSTGWIKRKQVIRARNVVVSAGMLGTLQLLFRCRDLTKSLPDLSETLGERVRTNNEAILGATSRDKSTDYAAGVAITSVVKMDPVTHVEPVRYPQGSGLIRLLASPLVTVGNAGIIKRFGATLWNLIKNPLGFLHYKAFADWASRTTIILVMQTEDTLMRLKMGRNIFTLFRRGLVADRGDNTVEAEIAVGHEITRTFAERTKAIPQASFNETLLNIPTTAHILGGVPMGESAEDSVIGLNAQVHNYPGLYVIDGSIMPANPGVNPTLTIVALAEFAMSQMPAKPGHHVERLLGVSQQPVVEYE